MAKTFERLQPRLYVITPDITNGFNKDALEAILKAADVASTLLWADAPEMIDKDSTRDLIACVQSHGCAALLRAGFERDETSGVDGVHSDMGQAKLREARAKYDGFIVGAGNLKDTHSAMEAGEAGADYVMFGGPQRKTTVQQLLDRSSWWQSLFETPCVTFVDDLDDVLKVAAAGADFVALRDALWNSSDPAKTAAELSQALATLAVNG